MVAIRQRSQGFVDVVDEFGKVQREGAHGFDGACFDHDQVVRGHVLRDLALALRIGLLIAVEPVEDRVALLRSGVLRRQDGAVLPRAAQDLAGMTQVLDYCRLLKYPRSKETEEEAHS